MFLVVVKRKQFIMEFILS